MTTNKELNNKKENECLYITFEKKYYKNKKCFIKRNLKKKELQVNLKGNIIEPQYVIERLKNEVKSIEYIRNNTDIPVPEIYCSFTDGELFYVIMEYIEGITMDEINKNQRKVVMKELNKYIEEMNNLTYSKMGDLYSGLCLIYPIQRYRNNKIPLGPFKENIKNSFVFCHNDLSPNNIIIDPNTLKIKSIIDWEYAGFYPKIFPTNNYHDECPQKYENKEYEEMINILENFNLNKN